MLGDGCTAPTARGRRDRPLVPPQVAIVQNVFPLISLRSTASCTPVVPVVQLFRSTTASCARAPSSSPRAGQSAASTGSTWNAVVHRRIRQDRALSPWVRLDRRPAPRSGASFRKATRFARPHPFVGRKLVEFRGDPHPGERESLPAARLHAARRLLRRPRGAGEGPAHAAGSASHVLPRCASRSWVTARAWTSCAPSPPASRDVGSAGRDAARRRGETTCASSKRGRRRTCCPLALVRSPRPSCSYNALSRGKPALATVRWAASPRS